MSDRDSFGGRIGPMTNPSFSAELPVWTFQVTVYPRSRRALSESATRTGGRRVTVDRPATSQDIKDILLGEELKDTLAGKG